MQVYAKDLRKMWDEKGPRWTGHHVCEAIEKEELSPHDFSLRDMAENLIPDGREFVGMIGRHSPGTPVYEATHAVDTGAFAHITGQLIFSTIKQAMQLDELIGDELVTTLPSQFQEAEIVPGISQVSDAFANPITQGEPYPLVGLTEEWVTIPRATKHGGILGITREMVIADRTGELINRAQSIGKGLAIAREKAILRTVLGLVDNHYQRNGETRNAYDDAAANMAFNNEDDAALADWTDIHEVDQVFRAMRDPNTGEPLGVSPKVLICSPTAKWVANHIVHAMQVRTGDITAAAGQTININLVPYNLTVLGNEWVPILIQQANGVGGIVAAAYANAILYWYLGSPKDAFIWKEIWPLTVEEAPQNSEAQFNQDVWMRFKASYKGCGGVWEPRYMVRSSGTA